MVVALAAEGAMPGWSAPAGEFSCSVEVAGTPRIGNGAATHEAATLLRTNLPEEAKCSMTAYQVSFHVKRGEVVGLSIHPDGFDSFHTAEIEEAGRALVGVHVGGWRRRVTVTVTPNLGIAGHPQFEDVGFPNGR